MGAAFAPAEIKQKAKLEIKAGTAKEIAEKINLVCTKLTSNTITTHDKELINELDESLIQARLQA